MNDKTQRFSRLGVFTWFPLLSLGTAGTMLLATVGNIWIRYLLGDLLDQIQQTGGSMAMLIPMIGCFLLLLWISPLCAYFREKLSGAITGQLYQCLEMKNLSMCQADIEGQSTGTLITILTKDVNEIKRYVDRIFGKFLPDTFTFVLTMAFFFALSPILGVAALLASMIPVVMMNMIGSQIFTGTKEYNEALDKVNHGETSGIDNLETVKAAQMEDAFLQADKINLSDLHRKKKKVAVWESVLGAPALACAFITQIIVMMVGGLLVIKGNFTIGVLLTVITLVDYIISPVMNLDGSLSAIKRAAVSIKRIQEKMKLPNESLHNGEEPLEKVRSIEFDQTSFGYPTSTEKVFENFSQRWEPGKIHLLLGNNGIGKSTVFKLMEGIYPVDRGVIRINDKPLEQYHLQEVRERVAAVTQEHSLFSGTIMENLAGTNNSGDVEPVHEVCRKLGIYEEIMAMPQGFETVLQEDGKPLSGGQKQRICLARAFLRSWDVLLLDEPTTEIDEAHKALLYDLLCREAKNKIIIVITHDPFWEGVDNTVSVLERRDKSEAHS